MKVHKSALQIMYSTNKNEKKIKKRKKSKKAIDFSLLM